MIKIAEWRDKSLEIGEEFDKDGDLEVAITDSFNEDYYIWLNKEEVKLLIEHLQSVIKNEKV
jgi:hypothetical protein